MLASSSRYRRELLERLRVLFEGVSPNVDETPSLANRLNRLCCACRSPRRVSLLTDSADAAGALVIGSDQVATFDGRQIGKPGTHENAVTQLRAMRERAANSTAR